MKMCCCVRYGMDGIWSDHLSPLSLAKNVVDTIQIATDSNTGGIYGVWTESGELYVSSQKLPAEWLAPLLLSNDVKDFYLLTESLSHAYLLWRTRADPLTLNLNHLMIRPSGDLEILPTESAIAPDGFLSDKPAVNEYGRLAVLWVTEVSDTPMLKIILYDGVIHGWDTSHPLQDFSAMETDLALLAAALENNWVVASRTLNP